LVVGLSMVMFTTGLLCFTTGLIFEALRGLGVL